MIIKLVRIQCVYVRPGTNKKMLSPPPIVTKLKQLLTSNELLAYIKNL